MSRQDTIAQTPRSCYEWPVHDHDLTALLDVNLGEELARLLAQIPAGAVTTYGALADALGDRVAARWVGERLLDHEHRPDCRCHRVVRKNGEPGLFIDGDSAAKLARLSAEGVPIERGRASVNSIFTRFKSAAPLRRLREFQSRVPAQLALRRQSGPVERVAALDVAYVSPREAVAACVVVETRSLETVGTWTRLALVTFPYVSGYLAFRELPLLLALWRELTRDGPVADLVLIDGNGILHPRRAGIAACFGLLANVRTIGIGKSLLCGRVGVSGLRAGETRPVVDRDELIGLAVKSTDRSRPILVSPGNHCEIAEAAERVQELFAGHRLPEPLHRADRLTKDSARAARHV